jgi:hypothetical protein
VRTDDDRVYLFTSQSFSNTLRVYWTTNPGLPNSAADFTGNLVIPESGNPISVDAVYDGSNLIHVLVNSQDGSLRDHPFNLTATTLVTGTPTVMGDYVGTTGVSGMFAMNGILHITYWGAAITSCIAPTPMTRPRTP